MIETKNPSILVKLETSEESCDKMTFMASRMKGNIQFSYGSKEDSKNESVRDQVKFEQSGCSKCGLWGTLGVVRGVI